MNAKGFTLIEALIAFTILAIVVGVTAEAMSSGLTLTGRADAAQIRLDRAQSILAAIGVETALEPGDRTGAFADGEAWRLSLSRIAEGAEAPDLYRADLTLFDGARPALSLSVLKLGG